LQALTKRARVGERCCTICKKPGKSG